MAEGIARSLGHDAASAGTEPADAVSKNAVIVCKEIVVDLFEHQPKLVDEFNDEDWEMVISMGCGVVHPLMRIDADWGLEDPHGGDLEDFRRCRDRIRRLVAAIPLDKPKDSDNP